VARNEAAVESHAHLAGSGDPSPRQEPAPLRISSVEDLVIVRNFLCATGYSADNLRDQFGVNNGRQLFISGPRQAFEGSLLELLVCLFILEESVKTDSLFERGMPPSVCQAMERLDMLRSYQHAPDFVTAPVRLQPFGDLLIASDRHIKLDLTTDRLDDRVFDPNDDSARAFAAYAPNASCHRFLELCSGSAVCAIRAARNFAECAWACDISERSGHFAQFNKMLNGVSNLTVCVGDLFEPVRDSCFDCIIMHPPYRPAPHKSDSTVLCRDAGELGEDVIFRVIAELPRHLSPGGCFYAYSGMPERRDMTIEELLRRHLGDFSEKFDVLVMIESESSPTQIAREIQMQSDAHPLQTLEQLELFRRHGISRFVQCATVLHRIATRREVYTKRYYLSERHALYLNCELT